MSIDADFTYINGLEVLNPLAGDPRSEGDDHLRGIKTAVKGTFPNIGAAAVTGTAAELNVNTGVTGGTVTASKTVVVDGSKDIGTFGTVTAATFAGTNVTGALDGILGGVTPAAITGTTIAGTVITASTSIATAAGATITDIDTAMDATPTDGQLLTSQGISEYVAARVFTGAAHTTYLAGESWSDAHGKGTVPDLIQAYAVKNATGGTDGGYTSGQKIVLTVVNSGDALDKGFNVWADTTNLYGSVHDGANLIAYSTAGANFNMTALEWDIYLVGVWFS